MAEFILSELQQNKPNLVGIQLNTAGQLVNENILIYVDNPNKTQLERAKTIFTLSPSDTENRIRITASNYQVVGWPKDTEAQTAAVTATLNISGKEASMNVANNSNNEDAISETVTAEVKDATFSAGTSLPDMYPYNGVDGIEYVYWDIPQSLIVNTAGYVSDLSGIQKTNRLSLPYYRGGFYPPTTETQILETAGCYCAENIEIEPIPNDYVQVAGNAEDVAFPT